MRRTHGRSAKGERVEGLVSGRRFARTNIIGARSCGKKLFATRTYEGVTVNGARFADWMRVRLAPFLYQGAAVILDNAPWHKGEEIRQIIEATGARLIFLPPYSPDLNPIEHAWANVKQTLKRLANSVTSLKHNLNITFNLMRKLKKD